VTDISKDAFFDALESAGRPVATAEQIARELDVTQAEAAEALDELAARGDVERADVDSDPVVWYPQDWLELTDRERVVVFPNRREIVVDQPSQFTRAQLSRFAHLADTTRTGSYRYVVREEDVWAAPFDSLTDLLEAMDRVLPRDVPALTDWVEEQWTRATRFRLTTHEDGYEVLEAESESLLGNVAEQHLADDVIRAPISDTEAWVAEEKVAELKRTLYEAGYPVQDERDLEEGAPLDVDLDLDLREYQADWVERFTDAKSGVLVGPPGSGKTVAAMGVLEQVGGETLILVPSRELAAQWRDELLANTSLTREQIGEYHGGEKNLRPVTIATYQTAGMDRHRHVFDDRKWGLIVYDECLTGDTIVETRRGRTTFEELDEQFSFDDGWNRSVSFDVRTVDPGSGEEWTAVTGVYKTTAKTETIQTNVGHSITATPNHTHIVFDPDSGKIEQQRGVSEGDFLVRPLDTRDRGEVADGGTAISNGDLRSIQHPSAELLGWFLGDGHLNEYGDVKFSFGTRTDDQIEILRSLCESQGVEYSVYGNSRDDETLRVPKLGERLAYNGPHGDKTNSVAVPPESYTWSDAKIGALLRGLFDAEGSVDKTGRVQFNSTSDALATDVSNLLSKLGIATRRTHIERSGPQYSDMHRLHVPTAYTTSFEKQIGFRLNHKAEALDTGESPSTGLPVGGLLNHIKQKLSLTERQIGEMMGLSRTTVGDVIRGKYRLGQPKLRKLPTALHDFARKLENAGIADRDKFNVTFDELSNELNCSIGHAYRLFDRNDSEASRGVETILNRRAKEAREYADRLGALKTIQIVEVTEISEGEKQPVYDFETEDHTFVADGFLTHNCHHIPSEVFRRSAALQSKHRLGLSATPVREDDKEMDIYTLIGPPIGTDWDALFEAGFVAEPEVEIRYVPWEDDDARYEYASESGHTRRRLAAENPAKDEEAKHLLRQHEDKQALVFVDYLEQGRRLADAIDAPFVSGETRHTEREALFDQFRTGALDTLVVSRIGDEGIDLPDAELAIVASGLGGSRRQGAQRAGRTMRPGGQSLLFVLATRGTEEEDDARSRMRHLSAKGIRVTESGSDRGSE
jgi:DNA excision repair protein ERCC-3